jgi:thiamine pyrophosphate-dependent acetolactate synthase large subunit-like protein
MARAVGAVPLRVRSAAEAVARATDAVATARHARRTVLLNLPLDVQSEPVPEGARGDAVLPEPPAPTAPAPESVSRLVEALECSQRPVFVAGRGARGAGARDALGELADRYGALLATSAVARGLFHDDAWSLDVSGGFASPVAAELITGADLIVGWGCALNMWTMRHGRLVGESATVAQVDDDPEALGTHLEVDVPVVGDVVETARAVLARGGLAREGYRTRRVADALRDGVRWRDVPYDDTGTAERIDPRTLSIALDDLLPSDRVVGVDSGNFMGYPSAYWSVPDERGFCFTQAFQSIGLGLSTAIGAALAQPDRLPVAALGDGGALMSAAELDTVRRLGLPMVVVVYDDDAYGAEVHHFGPHGHPLETVRFPETDIAAIARGYGFEAVTVRRVPDLEPVAAWVAGDRSSPLLVDAKVVADAGAWWLEEAFRGH